MASSFRADIDTASYMQAMRILDREALPRMVADTLNETAEAVSKRAKRNVQRNMIVRTKFTLNSIRQDRHARGPNVDRMYSRAASVSPYLAIHDEGGTIRAKGSRLPIPTLRARTSSSIRKKIARRYQMNRMGKMENNSGYFMGRPKGQSNRPYGIYERRGKRLRMLRNLESDQVDVPATHWHSEAADRLGTPTLMRARFKRNADRRLKRMARRVR